MIDSHVLFEFRCAFLVTLILKPLPLQSLKPSKLATQWHRLIALANGKSEAGPEANPNLAARARSKGSWDEDRGQESGLGRLEGGELEGSGGGGAGRGVSGEEAGNEGAEGRGGGGGEGVEGGALGGDPVDGRHRLQGLKITASMAHL